MKTLLMFRDRDFDLKQELLWNQSELTQDLELGTLLQAMAKDDKFLLDVVRISLLSGLQNDLDTILYRQRALQDCLNNPEAIRGLYQIAVETIEESKRHWFGVFTRYPTSILYESVDLLQMFVSRLKKLREFSEVKGGQFRSEAFQILFGMMRRELDDQYLAILENHLKELQFRKGVLLSAELSEGNIGVNYILRQSSSGNHPQKRRWPEWLRRLFNQPASAFTFRLNDRDEMGARILSDMRNSGSNLVANALAQSANHVLNFFETLRAESAFYVGCLNLYDRLVSLGEPVCFPRPLSIGERKHHFQGLYDPCLSLIKGSQVVGNTVDADSKSLVVITGANQGGKSIFLRSIGLAQMMMQCGMFVAAESFSAELFSGLFTHYKREEDATMKFGKLDEELARISDMAEHLAPNSLLLCNESFAATNEREGSEIARQIVSALMEKQVKIFFVTHLYEFANVLSERKTENVMFLRAERKEDGTRTYRVGEGQPLETSYGPDLYERIFQADQ